VSGTRRRRGERGSALAEFAICFPLFLLLMLAVVDLGVDYGDGMENDHAAADAAQAAATSNLGHDLTCSLASHGLLARRTRLVVCLAKDRTHRDPADVRVKVAHLGPDDVVVCVQSRAGSVSGMLAPVFDGRVHESRAAVRASTAAGRSLPEGAEDPLPGHDWAFCRADHGTAPDPI
jgi:hypothetical protein